MRVIAVEIAEVVTDRIVGRSRYIAGERQDQVVRRVGHLLVAPYAFLCEQVRIGAREAGGAVFVVNVDHQLVFGAFLHSVVHPFRPHLRTDLHEAELDPLDAPFVVKRQDRIELCGQCALVHIDPYADSPAVRITYDFFQVEVVIRIPSRIDIHARSIRNFFVFMAVPSRVEFDVLQVAFYREVNQLPGPFGRERYFAHHLARLDPPRIFDCTGRVEVQQQVVVFDQLSRLFGHHYHPPRRGERRDFVDGAVHRAGQRVGFPVGKFEFRADVIDHFGFGKRSVESARQFERQRTVGFPGPVVQRQFLVHGLGKGGEIGHRAFRQGEFCRLAGNMQVTASFEEQITERRALVVGAHL